MAPLFPRSGPGESSSPMSQVLLASRSAYPVAYLFRFRAPRDPPCFVSRNLRSRKARGTFLARSLFTRRPNQPQGKFHFEPPSPFSSLDHLVGAREQHRRHFERDLQDAHWNVRFSHSGLIFAALMIGHHFSTSDLWKAAKPSGVCCSRAAMSKPSSPKRARTPGSASVCTIAPLSLMMMSRGVPLGANSPNHPGM